MDGKSSQEMDAPDDNGVEDIVSPSSVQFDVNFSCVSMTRAGGRPECQQALAIHPPFLHVDEIS